MPSTIDDLIRNLGAKTPSASSSKLELGIEDVRAIVADVRVPDIQLSDLAAAVRYNNTVTHLSCTVDMDLAGDFFPVVNILLRKPSRVSELQITYLGPARCASGLVDEYDFGIVTAFIERCLSGVTHLTSLSLRIPEDSAWEGTLDWKIFSPFKKLQSLEILSDAWLDLCSTPLEEMLGALLPLAYLERVHFRGVFFNMDSFGSGDKQLMERFLGRGLLNTIWLDGFSFHTGTVFRSLALGLMRSTIQHLRLSYHCYSAEESSLFMAVIATCTEFRTLSLQGYPMSRFIGESRLPPLVCSAKFLRMNTRLTRLTLSRYQISDGEAESLSSELVRPSCVLEFLDLADCRVSHRSMGILLASQTAHTCMRELRLFRRIVSSTLARDVRNVSQSRDEPRLDYVEKALRGLVDAPLRSLRVVERGFQPCFDREQSRAVADCLTGNMYLETIKIQYLDEESQERMDSLGRLNAAGRRYLLSCKSRKAGVELLGKVSDNVTDVFVHLCENPSLCVF